MLKTLGFLAAVTWDCLLAGCSDTSNTGDQTSATANKTSVVLPTPGPSGITISNAGPICTPSAQAQSVVGHALTICGSVAEASYQPRTTGQPTFLDFDQEYPNHDFAP